MRASAKAAGCSSKFFFWFHISSHSSSFPWGSLSLARLLAQEDGKATNGRRRGSWEPLCGCNRDVNMLSQPGVLLCACSPQRNSMGVGTWWGCPPRSTMMSWTKAPPHWVTRLSVAWAWREATLKSLSQEEWVSDLWLALHVQLLDPNPPTPRPLVVSPTVSFVFPTSSLLLHTAINRNTPAMPFCVWKLASVLEKSGAQGIWREENVDTSSL